MSGLHRDKRATHNFSVILKVREDSGNKQEAKRAWKTDGHPRGGAPAPPAEPIRLRLADHASTTFEDEY
jgi:hypothetical protein